jgi:hypothetical protein
MIVILISGKQGSGKTTLAENIQNYFQGKIRPNGKRYEVYKLRFSEPLYKMHDACREVLKSYNYTFYDYDKKDGNLLQLIGTEWGRATVSPNLWVEMLNNKIRMLPKDAIVTVEDCRFENEFDAFMNVPHCIRVRLEASRQSRKLRASMWRENENHPSEVDLDHYAAMGAFDMTLNSDNLGAEEVLKQVLERATILYGQFETKELAGI